MEREYSNQKISERSGIPVNQKTQESVIEPERINFADSNTFRPVVKILRLTYGLVPIVAGLDKFTNLLTEWDKYLHPLLVSILPFGSRVFMIIVGIIEIVAGIIVLRNPRVGSIIVASWLTLIALNLIASGQYLDVAVRDLVMAIGAFSLFKLTQRSY